MGQKKLVIEIIFDEEQDEFDEDYTFLEFNSMSIKEDLTDVSSEQADNLAESWGQSDWYSVGFVNAFITMLTGKTIKAKDVKAY